MKSEFLTQLKKLPIVAILRGIQPQESIAVVEVLVEAGIRIVEVPMNSPTPLKTIELLTQHFGSTILIGAGTVVTTAQVHNIVDVGGKLIVSPTTDPAIINISKKLGLVSIPGATTPSEAYSAIAAGADAIKVFPAEMVSPSALKSWRSVIDKTMPLLPVGGIDHTNMQAYIDAGASGFGIGGNLYRNGDSLTEIKNNAQRIVKMIKATMAKKS